MIFFGCSAVDEEDLRRHFKASEVILDHFHLLSSVVNFPCDGNLLRTRVRLPSNCGTRGLKGAFSMRGIEGSPVRMRSTKTMKRSAGSALPPKKVAANRKKQRCFCF